MSSKVLVVDDEYAVRETLKLILSGDDYQILTALNGREALTIAQAERPDVILMDVMMPEMNGLEACAHIRADKNLAEIPVVLVTALDDRQSLLDGIKAGADDFITKPFDHLELRARVAGITRLNRYRKIVDERSRADIEHQRLLTAYDATIAGWSLAMDLRDKETEGHTRRVTELTVLLARELGVNDVEIQHIKRGALLHDIGKLGVPDSILLKAGKLSDEEWTIMRKHPIYAFEMLAPIEYLHPALDIPYYHHEKWDGTGYPRGLKGEEIPLAARIFAVVDVWDAITSDRPYRAAWSREKALNYILENSGSHFDPKIVEIFSRFINKYSKD